MVYAAAQRRLAEAKATKTIQREGIAPLGDPVELLRELAAEAVALKDFFSARLKALQELRYEGNTGEQLRSEVALYERALDRSQKFLHDLARLGLDERQIRIGEGQIVLVAAVLQRVLGHPSVGLDQEHRSVALELLASELDPS